MIPDFEACLKLMANEMTPGEVRAFLRQKGTIPYAKSSPVVSLTDSGEKFLKLHQVEIYVPHEYPPYKCIIFEVFF